FPLMTMVVATADRRKHVGSGGVELWDFIMETFHEPFCRCSHGIERQRACSIHRPARPRFPNLTQSNRSSSERSGNPHVNRWPRRALAHLSAGRHFGGPGKDEIQRIP